MPGIVPGAGKPGVTTPGVGAPGMPGTVPGAGKPGVTTPGLGAPGTPGTVPGAGTPGAVGPPRPGTPNGAGVGAVGVGRPGVVGAAGLGASEGAVGCAGVVGARGLGNGTRGCCAILGNTIPRIVPSRTHTTSQYLFPLMCTLLTIAVPFSGLVVFVGYSVICKPSAAARQVKPACWRLIQV
jgi:hypothetical protein